MAVALAALDARVELLGPAGTRTIPVTDLHRLPGTEPDRDTTLEPGELIVGVGIPPPAGGRSTYRKVRDRASFTFAVVSVAAALEVDDGVVVDCRIALGGVAHVPWRARRAEAALRGGPADEASFAAAAAVELGEAAPLRDNAFKVPLARAVIVRALVDLARAG
jgi:xanthine dehydrogenase YagS FAD-binding subunit